MRSLVQDHITATVRIRDVVYYIRIPCLRAWGAAGNGRSMRRQASHRKFSTGRTGQVTALAKPPAPCLSVSAGGGEVLYSQVDQTGADLVLVEHFR